MLKIISLSLFITLLFTACTHHTIKKPTTTEFTKVDNNRNGKISLNEYIAYVKKKERTYRDTSLNSNFEVCDQNGDGSLDLDEFKALSLSRV